MTGSEANAEKLGEEPVALEKGDEQKKEVDDRDEEEEDDDGEFLEMNEKDEAAVWEAIRQLNEDVARLTEALQRKLKKVDMEKETDVWYEKANEFIDRLHDQHDDVSRMEESIEYDFTLTPFVGIWRLTEAIDCEEYLKQYWTENFQRSMKKDMRIERVGHRITIGSVINGVPDEFPREVGFNEEVNGATWYVHDGHLMTQTYDVDKTNKSRHHKESIDRWVEDDKLTIVNSSRGKKCIRVFKRVA